MIEKYMTFSVSLESDADSKDTINIRNLSYSNLTKLFNNSIINKINKVSVNFVVSWIIDYLFEKNHIKNELEKLYEIVNTDWLSFFKNHYNIDFFEQYDLGNTDDVKKAWEKWNTKHFSRSVNLKYEEFIRVCFYYAFYIHPLLKNLPSLSLTGDIEINFSPLNDKPGLKSRQSILKDKIFEQIRNLESIIDLYTNK